MPLPPVPQKPATPSQPLQPKSLGGMFKESLFGATRPMPQPGQKPQPRNQAPGIFGEKGYTTHKGMGEFAKKLLRENLLKPGSFKPLTKEEKLAPMQRLIERAKQVQGGGLLSERTYKERILPQIKKELMYMRPRTKEEFAKKKALEGDVKIWEQYFAKGAQK